MNDQPIVCNINTIEVGERGRHADLVNQWRAAVDEVVELPAGYAFRLTPEKVNLVSLAEFIDRERLCCPFFTFEIVVEENSGPVWLRLKGSEDVKSFIRESLVTG